MKSSKKILITGGKGFIGTNLIFLLKDKYDIYVLDNLSSISGYIDEGFTFINGDVRDFYSCLQATKDMDLVVHLAAEGSVVDSVANPNENFENNVIGTFNILNASVKNGVSKFVMASTGGAIMGNTPPPVDESSLPSPISPYGASKLCGEAYCHAFAGNFSEGITVLRFANIYGEYSLHKKGLINAVIRKLNEGAPISIFGDGNATRDFLYVGDLCVGIERALEYRHQGVDIFHLSYGRDYTIVEIVEKLKSISQKPEHEVIFENKRAGEIERNFSIYKKAKKILGFEPEVQIDVGLLKTYEWVMQMINNS